MPFPSHRLQCDLVVVVVEGRDLGTVIVVAVDVAVVLIVVGVEAQTGHVILLMPLHVAQMVVGIYSPDFIV